MWKVRPVPQQGHRNGRRRQRRSAPKRGILDFVSRLRIVVKATDEGAVDFVVHACFIKKFLDHFKMIMTLFAQGIRDFWSPSHEGFIMVDLAVKDTQGAAVKAALAILAQFLQMRTEIVLQEGAVLRAAFRAADGIDLEFKVLEAKPFEDRNSKQDGFRIHHRGRGAHRFDAKLMELSHAASLGRSYRNMGPI